MNRVPIRDDGCTLWHARGLRASHMCHPTPSPPARVTNVSPQATLGGHICDGARLVRVHSSSSALVTYVLPYSTVALQMCRPEACAA
eukprot:3416389-Pyramimonas_sp.AAC.1